MEKIPDFSNQKNSDKTPVERFRSFDVTKVADYNEYYQKKFTHLKEEFKIKKLDDLLVELQKIINDWHKMTNINETDLREREMIIFEALIRLQPDQAWKNKHVDLFVDYIKAGDDFNLIKFVQEEFNLQQINPSGALAFQQISDEIKIGDMIKGEEKLDKNKDNFLAVDRQEIIKKRFTGEN